VKWANSAEGTAMSSNRQNSIVCIFDPKSPRISAHQIHEWIHDKLHLQEDDIPMIQIDEPRRRVFIRFVNNEWVMAVLQPLKGQMEYHHENGELSMVQVEIAGMGVRRVRVANLPPEVPDRILREALSRYGEVKRITDELWPRVYRYPVPNSVRVVEIGLQKQIPLHMVIVGNRVLLSYEGQPITCYGCNEPGHQFQGCPHRKTAEYYTTANATNTWAHIVKTGTARDRTEEERRNEAEVLTDNNDDKNEELHPLERGQESRNQEDKLTAIALESSLTDTENQYEVAVNRNTVSLGMDMEGLQESAEELGDRTMEQDWANQLSNTTDVERDDNKVGKKRDKPKCTFDNGRQGQEMENVDLRGEIKRYPSQLAPRVIRK
jgi:hypothetical protein